MRYRPISYDSSDKWLNQAWSRSKNLLKSKSKFIESKFSEPKSKSVSIESVFYVFVFEFGTTSIIWKNYDLIYFDTKFNRCYFDKYLIVSVLQRNIEMTPVSVAFKKPRVFFLCNLGFRPIFYGTGSVQGFLHLSFRPIFI